MYVCHLLHIDKIAMQIYNIKNLSSTENMQNNLTENSE